jgi:hypothetical protein
MGGNFYFLFFSTNPSLPHLRCLEKYSFVHNVSHSGLSIKCENFFIFYYLPIPSPSFGAPKKVFICKLNES